MDTVHNKDAALPLSPSATLQLLTHPFILKYKDADVDLAAYIQNVVNPTERLKDLSNVRHVAVPLVFVMDASWPIHRSTLAFLLGHSQDAGWKAWESHQAGTIQVSYCMMQQYVEHVKQV